MITSKEFAKLIGVSQSTVSRAMNDNPLVSEEKRKGIQQKAKEYGFALNSQARGLKMNKTGTIGILFPKHFVSMNSNMMLAHLYDKIQKEMAQYDYDIMVINNDYNSDFSSFERIIKRRKVDGFIVLKMELSNTEMQLIEENKIPCVFIMNTEQRIRKNINYCFSDSEYGGYLAGKYFGKQKDYQKIFITIKEEVVDAERRYKGFCRGLKEYQCEITEKDIFYCNLMIPSAYEIIMENRKRFNANKTAIFTYSDAIAIGVYNALRDLNINVPNEVQLIGMDDIPLVSWLRPAISTVHVNLEEMVPRACSFLIDKIENKQGTIREWVKPQLMLRDTTLDNNKNNCTIE